MESTPDGARSIPLTKGQFAIVDAADFDWLNQWKWQASWNPKTGTFYADREEFNGARDKRYSVRMHREILGLQRGDKLQGEHRNHNTLDNRRSNLRIATHSENMYNRRLNSNSSCGLKGVTRHGNYWRAQIQANRKHIVIGSSYNTPEEAHLAYCEKSKELHGGFHCSG
jgi:hypothetical protein